MLDAKTAEMRARMACRIYLSLFDAGNHGAPVTPPIALGGKARNAREIVVAGEVIADLDQKGLLSPAPSYQGQERCSLSAAMRANMSRAGASGLTIAHRLRFELAAHHRGDFVEPGLFRRIEAEIRTGDSEAAPL